MKLNSIVVTAAAITTAFCAACSSGGSGSGSGTTGKTASSAPAQAASCSGRTVGDSIPQVADPSLSRMQRGFDSEAKSFGMHVLTADANLDLNKQISDVSTFLTRKVDAVSIWPLDGTSLQPELTQTMSRSVPVVTQNTPDGPRYSTNIQFDDIAAGHALAIYLGEKLGRGAKVAAIIGPQQIEIFKHLAQGFAAGAKDAGLDVVATQTNADFSPARSTEIMNEFKTRYGSSLAGVFDTLNVTALAAASAVSGQFHPLVVTYSGAPTDGTFGAITDGRLAATAYVPTILIGRAKAWAVCQAIEGTKLPRSIEMPFLVADRSNLNSIPSEDRQLKASITFHITQSGSTQVMPMDGIDLPASAAPDK